MQQTSDQNYLSFFMKKMSSLLVYISLLRIGRWHHFSIYYLVLLLFFLPSCNRKTAKIIQTPQLPESQDSTFVINELPKDTLDSNIAIQDQKEAVLYYGKTSCYGNCPVYFIHIYRNGLVEYTGVKHTSIVGRYTGKISSTQLADVFGQIENLGFFSFESNYPIAGKRIKELPNTILMLNNWTTSKTVNVNYDAPKQFYQMERLLQQLISTTFANNTKLIK